MSFHVLKKRDNNLFSSFWHADAENLPNIPDVSFVNKKLRDHVIFVMQKARPVVERQIQELVAIKHVDPWHNIVHEMALPSKIDRNMLQKIIKIPENLVSMHIKPIDYIAIGIYTCLLLSIIPILCIHFIHKKIPKEGVDYICFAFVLAIIITAFLQIQGHAGNEFVKEQFVFVNSSEILGLGNLRVQEKPTSSDESIFWNLVWEDLKINTQLQTSENDTRPFNFELKNVVIPLEIEIKINYKDYNRVVGNEGNHTKVSGVLSALQLHPIIHTKDVTFEKKLYFGEDLIKKEKYNTNKILNQVVSNVFKFVKKELEQDIIKIIIDIKNV